MIASTETYWRATRKLRVGKSNNVANVANISRWANFQMSHLGQELGGYVETAKIGLKRQLLKLNIVLSHQNV